MDYWPYPIEAICSPDLVQEFCVLDPEWQQFRKTMKGHSTADKLEMLNRYRRASRKDGLVPLRNQVQIDNYLHALCRGGFLDRHLQVNR